MKKTYKCAETNCNALKRKMENFTNKKKTFKTKPPIIEIEYCKIHSCNKQPNAKYLEIDKLRSVTVRNGHVMENLNKNISHEEDSYSSWINLQEVDGCYVEENLKDVDDCYVEENLQEVDDCYVEENLQVSNCPGEINLPVQTVDSGSELNLQKILTRPRRKTKKESKC